MADRAEIWQCPQCGASLNIADLGFYAQVVCPGCEHSEYVHTMLANFRVEGVVGVGGMSVVLRARDLVLNRCVAIKVLNDTYRNQADRISRFENECAMMAKVRHDNVVSVYSAGRARKQFYIAMELVEGRDLETLVSKEGVLSPQQAIEYTIQIVQGLDAAHKAGLLHRDMKPGNVIITPEGKAKVLDFGLALGKQDEDTEEIIWATPYYVPPETLERKDEDCRTDIYALGMTLRYLLTGAEQFKEAAASVSDLLQCKFKLSPMASIMPGADESLCDLVDHMTAYDVIKRPANYRDLLAELHAVHAALLSNTEEQTPHHRRRVRTRLMTEVGVTAILGVSAAVGGSMIATPEPEREFYTVSENPYSWYDVESLALAEQDLDRKDYASAYARYKSLISNSTEPALAVWAAVTAAILCEHPAVAEENENAFDELSREFSRHAERLRIASPAAKSLSNQLQYIAANGEAPEIAEADVPRPYLRSFHYLRCARRLFKESKVDEANAYIQMARRNYPAANGPYRYFGELIDALVKRWAPAQTEEPNHVIADRLMQSARAAMVAHDVTAAGEKLNELIGLQGIDSELVDEARVLKEVCEVSAAAFEMLQRHCSNEYHKGDNASDVRNVLRTLNKGKLHDEVYCLCCLLSGNYQEAFRANPYTDDAREPFAVMMQDWQRRLNITVNR